MTHCKKQGLGAGKIAQCLGSSRGPGFNAQTPYDSSQQPVIPFLGYIAPSSGLHGHRHINGALGWVWKHPVLYRYWPGVEKAYLYVAPASLSSDREAWDPHQGPGTTSRRMCSISWSSPRSTRQMTQSYAFHTGGDQGPGPPSHQIPKGSILRVSRPSF